MNDSEVLQMILSELKELKQGQSKLEQGQSKLEQGQSKLEQGQSKLEQELAELRYEQIIMKTEMHERFDKLETITEFALKEIDMLEQAYKAMRS